MRPFGCLVIILNTIDHLGSGPNWLFDIDALTKSMNYKPVVTGNQSNGSACTKACDNACKARIETVPGKDYILLPVWPTDPLFSQSLKDSPDAGFKPSGEEEKKDAKDPWNEDSEVPSTEESRVNQEKDVSINSTNNINTVSPTVNAVGIEDYVVDENIVYGCADDPNMPELEDIVYSDDDEDVGAEADMNNLDSFMPVSPIPTTRIHKDHPIEQIIRDLNSAPQTRRMTKSVTEHAMFSSVQQRTNQKTVEISVCMFFITKEPKKVKSAFLYVMIEKEVCFINHQDMKDLDFLENIQSRKEGKIDKTLFIERTKVIFFSSKIEKEVYVCQPPGFEDPDFPDRRGKIDKTLFIRRDKGDILLVQVYVDDIIFGSTKKSLLKQKEDGIFINQDKYVTEILNKFGFTDVTVSTPMETQKPLLKDEDGEEVNVYLYRSMIRSLMYLTSLRPDIMFEVCACARYQVNPKVSHLYAVKMIFRYLKAYTDSDYAGASLDRKSTIGGCQFLGCRLISWQCKKQNVVVNSTTKDEYIAASNCCGQSTICTVKNPVFHSKTKHIEIGHHFIRDSNEKKLIQMIKIQTDQNVADLLTKAFDVSIFQYLISSIGMLNL
ncbi:hypothetical protein Tco_1214909 [Tanacetum coccineum]